MIVLLVAVCFFQSGCALITLPLKIVGGTLNAVGSILKGIFQVAKSLPKPPPGVF